MGGKTMGGSWFRSIAVAGFVTAAVLYGGAKPDRGGSPMRVMTRGGAAYVIVTPEEIERGYRLVAESTNA